MILIYIAGIFITMLFSIGIYQTLATQQNIFIKHEATKFTSQSRWLVALPLNLEIYSKPINVIADHLFEIRKYVRFCNSEVNRHNKGEDYTPVMQLIVNQIEYARTRITTLQNKSTEISSTLSKQLRVKRSLIPFLGNILSDLTGVATEDDLQVINQRISNLVNSDEDLVHIVEDSLTVVNATKHKLNHVTDTVDSLIDAFGTFQETVYNATKEIFEQIDQTKVLYKCLAHPTLLMNSLLHNVEAATSHLNSLQNLIDDTLQGQLTMNVIQPNQFRSMLQEIEKALPQNLRLPYDIDRDLYHYYHHLTVRFTTSSKGPIIIISIPLKSLMSEFNYHKIVYMPIPVNNSSLLLTYEIPHKYLALSPDHTKIVYLTDFEYAQCVNSKADLCHFRSPIRFADQVTNDCSTSLLLDHSISNCKVKLTPNNLVLPQSHWLTQTKWLVIHDEPQKFTLLCTNRESFISLTKPPADIIEIPIGCKAQSQNLAIPESYYSTAHIDFVNIKEFIQYNVSTYERLIGPHVSMALQKLPKHVEKLVKNEVSIPELEHHINRHLNHLLNPSEPLGKHFSYIWSPILALIAMAVIVFIIWKLSKRFKKQYNVTTSDQKETSVKPIEIDKSATEIEHQTSTSSSVFAAEHALQSIVVAKQV